MIGFIKGFVKLTINPKASYYFYSFFFLIKQAEQLEKQAFGLYFKNILKKIKKVLLLIHLIVITCMGKIGYI